MVLTGRTGEDLCGNYCTNGSDADSFHLYSEGQEAVAVADVPSRRLNGSAAAQPPSALEKTLHTTRPSANWQQVSCTPSS